jgi:hypothetical protein
MPRLEDLVNQGKKETTELQNREASEAEKRSKDSLKQQVELWQKYKSQFWNQDAQIQLFQSKSNIVNVMQRAQKLVPANSILRNRIFIGEKREAYLNSVIMQPDDNEYWLVAEEQEWKKLFARANDELSAGHSPYWREELLFSKYFQTQRRVIDLLWTDKAKHPDELIDPYKFVVVAIGIDGTISIHGSGYYYIPAIAHNEWESQPILIEDKLADAILHPQESRFISTTSWHR